MPELCYTATQVKLVKTSIMFMVGITFAQALAIRRLVKAYAVGRQRFDTLHEGTVYLLDIIHENNIDMSEFDVIALTNIFEEK